MKLSVSKWDSLYVSLFRLVIGAIAAAILFFFCVDFGGEYLVVRWYHESHYVERKEKAYIKDLQDYVDRYQVSIQDKESLTRWLKDQKILSLKIYQDQWLVYDSFYKKNLENLTEEEREQKYNGQENYYPVCFPDGNGEAVLYGAYKYQLYIFVVFLELLATFLVFLGIMAWGIRRKMEEIRRLGREIEILETGNLDYAITVRGKDELAALAEGVDCMRRSLREQIEQEALLVRENQEMVTEMSHDLRTHLTSILLYTEILQKGAYKNPERLLEYLEKIHQKASRLKQLSDHLFEYALIAEDAGIQLEQPEEYKSLFYDLLSETCSYLEQKGFQAEAHLEWKSRQIRVDENYVARILDNITSNIVKYGQKERPVIISCSCDEETVRIAFENAVKAAGEPKESSGIGLPNIRKMMERMGGSCRFGQRGGQFYIHLFFPQV